MQNNFTNLRVLWRLVLASVALLGIYEVGGAVYTSQTSGVLDAKASNSMASLTVGRAGHKMANIGTGQAKVHLAPGSYKVYASYNHLQASADFRIDKKKSSTVDIKLPDLSSQNQRLNRNASANSLIKLLPYTGPNGGYIIGYKYTISGGVANPTIIITAPNDKAKQDALAWITHVGFNPSSLEIEYSSAAE